MKRAAFVLTLAVVATFVYLAPTHHLLDVFSFAPFLLGMANAQVGRQLLRKSPPKFEHCTVRGGTWEEEDATKVEMNEDADEELFNTSAYDQGANIKCDVYPDADFDPQVNDVLPEIDVDTPRSFVITKITRKRYGKRGLIYSLELIQRAAQDTSIVS